MTLRECARSITARLGLPLGTCTGLFGGGLAVVSTVGTCPFCAVGVPWCPVCAVGALPVVGSVLASAGLFGLGARRGGDRCCREDGCSCDR